MKFKSDIDIDVANRESVLAIIPHTKAAIKKTDSIQRHPSGIYVTDIPYDSLRDMSNLDYIDAENRGYFKLDVLNVHVYEKIKNEEHLIHMMREPDWSKLLDKSFVEQLTHLKNHYQSITKLKEPITSIPRLAMFLALIRPSKRHLIGLTWKEIAQDIWRDTGDAYAFKKSHSIGYAHLVVVHMNLLTSSA